VPQPQYPPLHADECSGIFPESLVLLVERMRNLKTFSIASLEVTDRFLEMVGQHMPRLQVLSLEYCRKVTDQGVLNMLYRSPSLLRLDLQHTALSEKNKKVIFDELSSRSLYGVIG
jgi:hypothetical protein